MSRNAPVSSAGKRDSSRTRFRRSPTILSTCSMSTGQASTQAPQVTQSQTASYGIASSTIGGGHPVRCRRRVVEAVRLADDRRVRDQVEPVLRLDRHVPDAHDERLRVERLAGVPGRAGLLAAAALGAGEAVEEVLPAEVLERLQAERRVLALEVHRRQLAARLRACGTRCSGTRSRCGGASERQVDEERRDERDVGPPQRRRSRPRGVCGDEARAAAPASAAETNAPGWSPCAANSKTSASSSVATTPPIIARISSASRLNVRRRGRETSRRQNAHRIDTRTITATTFCIAEIAAQSSAVERHRQDRLDEPAGDDVGRPDRQQDEAPEDARVHQPGPRGP